MPKYPLTPLLDHRERLVDEKAASLGRAVTACAGAEGESYETHRLSDLLPHAFGPADLGIGG